MGYINNFQITENNSVLLFDGQDSNQILGNAELTQKLILRASVSINRLCLKADLNVDLKMTGFKNDMEKDVTLDIKKKLADILKIKSGIEINLVN